MVSLIVGGSGQTFGGFSAESFELLHRRQKITFALLEFVEGAVISLTCAIYGIVDVFHIVDKPHKFVIQTATLLGNIEGIFLSACRDSTTAQSSEEWRAHGQDL